MLNKLDFDDKDLVIVSVLILGITAMCVLDAPENIVSNIITGLFAIAVGSKLGQK